MHDIKKLYNYFAAQAMKALIEARAHLPEEDENSVTNAIWCGTGSKLDLNKEDGGKYAWGELVAEEAFEMADFMMEEVRKRGTYE